MNKFKKYFFFFIVFCFLGYIWEVFYTFYRKGVIINMGTLNGPWLPIYGSGGLLIYFIYKKIKTNTLSLFFISSFMCAVIEYATSFYLEKVYGLSWWNYSHKPYNLNGRIYLEGILFFGLFSIICIKFFLPLLENLYDKLKGKTLSVIIYILFGLFTFDFIYCTFNPNTSDAKKVSYNNVDFYKDEWYTLS